MKEISIYELFKIYQKDDNINLIDIRDSSKFKMYHIHNSVNMPCAKLYKTQKELRKDETYYIIDYNNELSTDLCYFLSNLGYNTISVFGGIKNWKGKLY